MDRRRVVITGLGVVAPNGIGKESFWEALRDGTCGIGRITRFDPTNSPCKIAGEIKKFNPELYMDRKEIKRSDIFTQYGISASIMAVKDASLQITPSNSYRIGIVFGTSIGGISCIEKEAIKFYEKGLKSISPTLATQIFPGNCANRLSIKLGVHGYGTTISSGCATGLDVIGNAFDAIKTGKADAIVAGSSDTPVTPGIVGACFLTGAVSKGTNRDGNLPCPFDKERDGVVLSEGAGAVVLEELEYALKRKTFIYGEIIAYGTTYDAYHITHPSPTGEEAEKAIMNAIYDAGISSNSIDYICAHGCATILNDEIETSIIKKIYGKHASKISISSIEGAIGHAFGTAGIFKLITCALVLEKQIIPPTINYSTPDPMCDLDYTPNHSRERKVEVALAESFSFGGKNSCVIVKKFKK